MTSFPATTDVVCWRAWSERCRLHTDGAAKQWHAARVAIVSAASASSREAPAERAASEPALIAARTSSSPERSNIAKMAATPAPMECPVMRNANPEFSASARVAAGSCVLATWYADPTIPACAHPPRKGTDVLHASVRRSDVLTVPRMANTTVRASRSTATYDAGDM